MRSPVSSPRSHLLWAPLALSLILAAPAVAQEATSGVFPLDTELYRGLEAAFGEVAVEEDGAGGLHFTVSLDPEVAGEHARIRRLFLSIDEWPAGLEAVPDDPDAVRMGVHPQRRARHTMGADFGAVVFVRPRLDGRRHHRHHRHRGKQRPEPVQSVGFTLRADAPLALDDVLAMKATWLDAVTQIGVKVDGLDLGKRRRAPGLLSGLFEPDPPPSSGGGSDDDVVIPPGCFPQYDPVTGDLIWVVCPSG